MPIAPKDVLAARPLTPTNVDLFVPTAYPDARPMAPAAGPPPTTAEVRAMLRDYLRAEFPSAPTRRAEGMALFDDPDLIAKVANPSLRAGLIGLMGTSGEPAIDFILDAETSGGLELIDSIRFGPLTNDRGAAAALINNNTHQVSFLFNEKYISENPFQFTRIMAHEPLHVDPSVAPMEEVINLALDTHVYLEQLISHPDLASADTELTRRSNSNALARLNSGKDGELGLFGSDTDEPLFPGGALTYRVWFDQFADMDLSVTTAGAEMLRAYLANIAEPGSVVPARPDFDMRTLRFIDRNGGLLSDALRSPEGLRVFDALGLANVERGSAGRDRMIGTVITDHLDGLGGADTLRGFAGADRLSGGRGGDRLFAGAGADDLAGGAGRDALWGEAGADTFRFGPGDTSTGRARDVIGDFQPDRDRIVLAAVDADATRGGNQAFDFIGGARFSGDAGELRFRAGVLSGDVDSDGRPDLQIELADAGSLRGSDLLL